MEYSEKIDVVNYLLDQHDPAARKEVDQDTKLFVIAAGAEPIEAAALASLIQKGELEKCLEIYGTVTETQKPTRK